MTHLNFRVVDAGTVGSTQDELRQLIRAGEDVAGLCLRAEAQTSGKGRRGTTWSSPPGGSYQSVGLGRQTWPWLTLALGVGIAGALRALPGSPDVLVKWPNDLYLEEGKLGGILTEVAGGQVIAGVGVNVTNPTAPGAARLKGHATGAVSDAVLAGIGAGLTLAGEGGQAVRTAFAPLDFLVGRSVAVALGDPTGKRGVSITGVARGVTTEGWLRLEAEATGESRTIEAGHVLRFCPRA